MWLGWADFYLFPHVLSRTENGEKLDVLPGDNRRPVMESEHSQLRCSIVARRYDNIPLYELVKYSSKFSPISV